MAVVALAGAMDAGMGRAEPLALDAELRPRLTTAEETGLTAVVRRPGGGYLVAGRFDVYQGQPARGLAHLDGTGRLDRSFDFRGEVRGEIKVLAIQPDGRILAGGRFTAVDGGPCTQLIRLLPDGRPDPSFVANIGGTDPAEVQALVLASDGRILVGGSFQRVDEQNRRGVARLEADGRLDERFDPGQGFEDRFAMIYDLALTSEGSVIAAGVFTKVDGEFRPGLARLRPDGRLDGDYVPDLTWSRGLVQLFRVILLPEDRLLVFGRFDGVDGQSRSTLVRLDAEGHLDEGFWLNRGEPVPEEESMEEIALTVDGGIVVAGTFEAMGEHACRHLARLDPQGGVDAGFALSGGLESSGLGLPGVRDLLVGADGSVLVVGEFDRVGGESRQHVARVNADGGVDVGFGLAGTQIERAGIVNCLEPLADGGCMVGGYFDRVDGVPRVSLARLKASGALDPDFDAPLEPGAIVNALVSQADGKRVVGGRFLTSGESPRTHLVRLLADGSLDASFDVGAGPAGEVYCLAVQSDGSVVFGGDFDSVDGAVRERVARVNTNGVVDPEFRVWLAYGDEIPEVYTVVAQADGMLLLGGYFDQVNGKRRVGLVRVGPDGGLDPKFNPDLEVGGQLPLVLSARLQPDGKVLFTGTFDWVGGLVRRGVARVDADGRLDGAFNPGLGVAGGDIPAVNALGVLPGGAVLIAGEFSSVDGVTRGNLARLNAYGNLDPRFQVGGGTDQWINAVAVERDGAVLVGGAFTSVAGEPRQGLARLRPVPNPRGWLHIARESGSVHLTWEGAGELEWAPSVAGPWTLVPVQNGGQATVPEGKAGFYRLRH